MWEELEDAQISIAAVVPGEQLAFVTHMQDTCQPHAVTRVKDLFRHTSKKSLNN